MPLNTLVMINPDFIPRLKNTKLDINPIYLRKSTTPVKAVGKDVHYGCVPEMQATVQNLQVSPEEARFLAEVSADVNNLILAEREQKPFTFGSFLSLADNTVNVRYCYFILKKHKIDVVLHHNYPHEVFNYILQKLALALGIPCFQVCHSVLPWRVNILQCMPEGGYKKMRLSEAPSDTQKEAVKPYFQRLRGNHDAAIPATDVKAISVSTADLDYTEERKALLSRDLPKSLLRIVKKWRTYKSYRNHVSHGEIKQPYVVFFMHYQPEETTMPRGGVYAQQLIALATLRALMPPEVEILVKENKATYRWPFTLSMNVRSESFYAGVNQLPNVRMVPLSTDTFELIDHSIAVSTITGTVGLESLCRGKPSIIFGDVGYDDFQGVTKIKLGEPLPEIGLNISHDSDLTLADLEEELIYSCGAETSAHETVHEVLVESTYEGIDTFATRVENWLSER